MNPVTALAVILIILCISSAAAVIKGINGVYRERAALRKEAQTIISADYFAKKNKKKIQKREIGLSLKLSSFTIALILLVVILISAPMYILVTNTQRETLLESLWDRSVVLLEGIAFNAQTYLPRAVQSMGERGAQELSALPFQSAALPEARYITITGAGFGANPEEKSVYTDHVLATNDPDINKKIDTAEYRQGISRLIYSNEILPDVPRGIGSYPRFSADSVFRDNNSVFIFYKPLFYRQGTGGNSYSAVIRLEVSLESIISEIHKKQITLLSAIGIVSLIVIVTGVFAVFIFSGIIVSPIRKLVEHIEIIRDTQDKTQLAGVDIQINTRDEIAILGNTINDMTHGIVKAAIAASDLSISKEIQNKFIPLEVDSQGNKLSSGFKQTPNLIFFGFYEGAKVVSGDYFDYKDLDGRYYAIIKCDAAGQGIPAALIMIQVATMFLNYFKQWKPNERGMHIEEIVYQINDFIETLGFKGRFAAFTLCLFDSQTGILRFCNAGDNVIRYYDASDGCVKKITLQQTPAAGALPNSMIEAKGGYNVQTIRIDRGDILLLYTDGIEESKRNFRKSRFSLEDPRENHYSGKTDEELGPERVEAIINAVMARQIYTLRKHHNPEGITELQFDFSACEGSVEEVIMAMVSAEKMFRCYKGDDAGEDSRVLIYKKTDEFLKKHFLQYRHYCSQTKDFPENSAYMYYTHVMEDELYDDLTILGIKRK